MMRKNITRTMATSKITGYEMKIVDGKPTAIELPVLTVAGKVTEKEGLEALKAEHEQAVNVMIGNIEVVEDTYEISVEDFLKYATKVEKAVNSENEESK